MQESELPYHRHCYPCHAMMTWQLAGLPGSLEPGQCYPLPGNNGSKTMHSVHAVKSRSADRVCPFQIHWPGFPIINNWATNSFVEGLARVHRAGLSKAVGVSNFKASTNSSSALAFFNPNNT